ncbi:hypothetical protein GQ607_002698 [Colletotrichum asianum]|uniref:Uncharacterized protein n=1 Tax=Colletotrichum asianum TaxID=702518 RepID=A0A8H3WQ37_9PEZI|nr:hypothetical protein GQ607_002698 [Colletotrichum asianum]
MTDPSRLQISLHPARTDREGAAAHYVENWDTVNGQAWKDMAFVQVSWGWMLFLGIEIVMASTFLGLTIWSQRDSRGKHQETPSPLRDAKSSCLVTLVALSSACRDSVGRARSKKELERAAKGLQVRLDEDQVITADSLRDNAAK